MEHDPIRACEPRDLPAIVRLHQLGLGDSFLGRMGADFVARLYDFMLADPSFICLVIEREGRVAGYINATIDRDAFYRRIYLRNFVPLAILVVRRALRAPSVLLAALGVVTGKSPASAYPPPHSELLDMVIEPSLRQGGIGKELQRRLFVAMAARGARSCCAVVAKGIPAHRFHQANGFRERTTFVSHGVECSFYEVSFDAAGVVDRPSGAASSAAATSASATATSSSSK